jgi:hypothetical protein
LVALLKPLVDKKADMGETGGKDRAAEGTTDAAADKP